MAATTHRLPPPLPQPTGQAVLKRTSSPNNPTTVAWINTDNNSHNRVANNSHNNNRDKDNNSNRVNNSNRRDNHWAVSLTFCNGTIRPLPPALHSRPRLHQTNNLANSQCNRTCTLMRATVNTARVSSNKDANGTIDDYF